MGEGYKPSWGEQKKAEGMMGRDQKDESIERQSHILGSEPILREQNIREVLDQYEADIDRLGTFEGVPPQWKEDAEKARKIQSEINQKLEELKGLFKSEPQE